MILKFIQLLIISTSIFYGFLWIRLKPKAAIAWEMVAILSVIVH